MFGSWGALGVGNDLCTVECTSSTAALSLTVTFKLFVTHLEDGQLFSIDDD